MNDLEKAALDAATKLHMSGDTQGAEAAYKSLAKEGSKQASVYSNLAAIHMDRKDPEAAIDLYQKAISLQPDFALAHYGQGLAHAKIGKSEPAITAFQQSIKFDPQSLNAYYHLGNELLNLSHYEEAFSVFTQVSNLFPNQYMALFNLGFVRELQKRSKDSIQYFSESISIKSDWAKAHFRLALNLEKVANVKAAEKSYGDGLALEPDNADAHFSLAKLMGSQGKFHQAMQFYRNAWLLNPDLGIALIMYWKHRQDCCEWKESVEMHHEVLQFIQLYDEKPNKTSMSPFPLLAMFDDPVLHKRVASQYFRQHIAKIQISDKVTTQSLTGQKQGKIRLAYLSADFRSSVVYNLMAEVFEKHDREIFEVHAISYGIPSEDLSFNQRLHQSFDHFHNVHNCSDKEIAELISATEIHIAIDIMGYTGNAQPFILAYRPAPIQISYLGYLGTMATDFIDYVIADQNVLPENEQENYSEKIIYLPNCYQANCSQMDESEIRPTREQCGLPTDGFVFCSFNNSYKINPQVFDLWMDLLKAVDGSVLWLYRKNRWIADNLYEEAEIRGVDRQRIIFAEYVPLADHLTRLENADLFLDTFPYGAGATCSFSLWAGLPLITLPGRCFTSRMAASQLTAMGLEELIVANTEEYSSLAIELASNPGKLTEIASTLKARRSTAALFDTERFVKNLESAFCSIWQKHCEGTSPETLMVKRE